MDSEITLVNPALPVRYFLSSSDLTDAVIFAEPAVPLYRVTSDSRHIKIYDSTTANRLIAVFHRRDILWDTISFPTRCGSGASKNKRSDRKSGTVKQMSIQRWLKRSMMPDGTFVFTLDTEYGPYVWKGTSGHRLKVFADHDLENPIASCYLYRSLPPNHPAFILQSAGEPLRDDIVVAYIIQLYRIILESQTLDLFVGSHPSRRSLRTGGL